MIDTTLIPKPNHKSKVVKNNGNTQDIINSIQRLDNYKSIKFDKFAKQFSGDGGLKRLWSFVKYQINYKKDSFETSQQLTPPALWDRKYEIVKVKLCLLMQF